MDCPLEQISNYFNQATLNDSGWEDFYYFHWGRVFCGLIHIVVLKWLVWCENFLLKFICFIFHNQPAILGRIRLPHAGSFPIHFNVNIHPHEASIQLQVGMPAALILSAPGLSAKPLEKAHSAIENDADQHLDPSWQILPGSHSLCALVFLLKLRDDLGPKPFILHQVLMW